MAALIGCTALGVGEVLTDDRHGVSQQQHEGGVDDVLVVVGRALAAVSAPSPDEAEQPRTGHPGARLLQDLPLELGQWVVPGTLLAKVVQRILTLGLAQFWLIAGAGAEVEVDDETGEKLLKLMDLLNEHDDVQNVYANFEVSDAVVAKMSA